MMPLLIFIIKILTVVPTRRAWAGCLTMQPTLTRKVGVTSMIKWRISNGILLIFLAAG